MWTCPVCGRSFKNTSQNHSCVKPENIDDYISRQPEDRRDCLTRIRTVIAAAIPQAKECIAWSMPTFRGKRIVIQFAAAQNHVGLFPGPEAVEFFAEELKDFQTGKGTVRLPYSGELPEELLARIACWCWENSQD